MYSGEALDNPKFNTTEYRYFEGDTLAFVPLIIPQLSSSIETNGTCQGTGVATMLNATDTLNVDVLPKTRGTKKSQTDKVIDKEECSESINKALKRTKSQIQYCYDVIRRDYPNIKREITISFDILDTGKTTEVTATDTGIDNPAFVTCIKRKIKRWNFPRNCSTSVTKPYMLHSE